MQVSIDNISYFKCKKIPDPQNLMCCICYCLINKKGKQCKNKKCLKIYCADCNLKLVFQNVPCSYCRISKEYIGLDEQIIVCLDNLLFYCPEFECKEHYELEEFKSNHNHESINNNNSKCNICQFTLEKNPNYLTCNVCNSKYCFKNLDYIPYRINKSNIKKFDEKDNCMKRCINCLTPICNRCNTKFTKYKLNNFICEFCEINCSICSDQISITYCDYCHKPVCEKCFKNDEKNNLILCLNDNDKNNIENKPQPYFVSEKNETCPICKVKINDINSLVKCKVDNCKNKFICNKCSLFCNICKKIICKDCSLYCNQCSPNLSLVSCKVCNSNTIKKCTEENCNNNLCISCYNSCNQCNIILCNEHRNQCLNCQDSMCPEHYSICKICDKEGYKKACIKKCTYKCSFCENMNNEICNKDNHKNTFVKKYNCEHNICLECVKKCEKCKKVVRSCLMCAVDYYFIYCNFCNKYKCFDCGKQCNKCEDYYCDYKHKCNLCKKDIKENTCLKCINNSRVKCSICKKTLKQCEDCKKFLICSKRCYLENRSNKKEHLCQMFLCDDCLEKNQNYQYLLLRENNINDRIYREVINKNNNISSERQMSNNENIKKNVLNNQILPNLNNNVNNSISFSKNNISISSEKKVCCDCCINF